MEGTYIFRKNNKYHILYTERGKIRSEIVTGEEREVLWNVLGIVSADRIMDFAMRNREKGKDFRRAFFSKDKEIEEILRRNPYNDK